MIRAALAALLISAGPLWAEGSGDAALKASADLRKAITALDAAQSKSDRIAALTKTIHAYEQGLSALRDGLRRAAIREREIKQGFDAKREELGGLLAVMSTMQQSDGPLLLLHPSGPEGSARSGMVLSSVAPALQEEAQKLSVHLEEIATLRKLQENARETLEAGMVSVTKARTALSEAISERREKLPQRYLEEPEELTALVQSADTLEGFATGLSDMENDIGPPRGDFAGAKGTLNLPVIGSVLRSFNEPDAAGIKRPGLVIASEPGSLVTTPWAATIRYRGPLLDYGNVMVLEPADGYLLVLAGLGTVYGEVGDVLPKGTPIGLMGGIQPGAKEFGKEFVQAATDGAGADRSETLYLELREGGKPVDPTPWFIQTKDDKG
ncbi:MULTISPECIES: murein hydrolase activator EnvC family protein [Thioclava]|uniref:murein hydrolase activator EnvC family protein n=1 Tax=Thioclava TaxID=285107 RepID=UPI000998CAEA|nr:MULTISPECIES: peptidoglycan DD-metalloendopeptidase family protein [Thioclava]MAQ37561.1 peptidase M23 [Thioclava sp.]MPQ94277.1 peptidoglycan DD-metalloendopeptidase family protein [Thioclava sp. JE_KL1]OOY20065.1 peptidase M23 [Thioclava sp. DLFJ5-1]